MSQILKIGQEVHTIISNQTCIVESYIGSGGQGEVYVAKLNSQQIALKWYFTASATPEQYQNLTKLVRRGQPNNKYLWPMDIAEAAGIENFGYIMPLRESRFKSLFDLMYKRIDPTFRALTIAGRQLADSFFQLHSQGLCYRDISFGNVFFDPDTGEILICDNDNVVENGMVGGIVGTPDFMAPEIVRGEAKPSTNTDLFSLSVLLFYLLHIHHPLFGKKLLNIHVLDLPARTKLCGTEPVFIFDPKDKSNEAVDRDIDSLGEAGSNALLFWNIYPKFIRNLFTQAFTEGLHDPHHKRVRETEWRNAMTKLQNSLLYCGNCKAENFYDTDALRDSGKLNACWSCKQELKIPARLRIGNNVLMLNYDTNIFEYHIDVQNKEFDLSKKVASVNQHPANSALWGLKNLQTEKWVITTVDGIMKEVNPGENVLISNGTKINFGKSEGEIRM